VKIFARASIVTVLLAVRINPLLRFDAIIVDEAQDFRTHWWIAIEEVLKDPAASWLHAYFDTNQSIYGDLTKELASFRIVPIHLTRNLRNTRCIHAVASHFYKDIPVVADGPEGMQVQWTECRTQPGASDMKNTTVTEMKPRIGTDCRISSNGTSRILARRLLAANVA